MAQSRASPWRSHWPIQRPNPKLLSPAHCCHRVYGLSRLSRQRPHQTSAQRSSPQSAFLVRGALPPQTHFRPARSRFSHFILSDTRTPTFSPNRGSSCTLGQRALAKQRASTLSSREPLNRELHSCESHSPSTPETSAVRNERTDKRVRCAAHAMGRKGQRTSKSQRNSRGRDGGSSTERLPKSERTKLSSKVQVHILDPDAASETLRSVQASSSASSYSVLSRPSVSSNQDAKVGITTAHSTLSSASQEVIANPLQPSPPYDTLNTTTLTPTTHQNVLTQTPTSGFEALPGDILRRILEYAGFLSTVSATYVCQHWRQVAELNLSEKRRADVARIFHNYPDHTLHSSLVLNTLTALPSLRTLSFQRWPQQTKALNEAMAAGATFDAALASTPVRLIPTKVLREYTSQTIVELDLSGIYFEPTDLLLCMSQCRSLCTIRLASSPSVSDDLTGAILRHRRHALKMKHVRAPLETLDLTHSVHLSQSAVEYLLRIPVLTNLVATQNTARGRITAGNTYVSKLNFASSPGLTSVALKPADSLPSSMVHHMQPPLTALNLSQCTNLTFLALCTGPDDVITKPLALRVLNLSGASSVVDILLPKVQPRQGATPQPVSGTADQTTGVADALGNMSLQNGPPGSAAFPTASPLANLEELSLYGARSLRIGLFRSAFGFSSTTCMMPRLRTLNLNGVLNLDCLVLVGYHALEIVDCSGCINLHSVHVRDVPRLQNFSIMSTRAPLRDVDLRLPTTTTVKGRRSTWRWEKTAFLLEIFYAAQ